MLLGAVDEGGTPMRDRELRDELMTMLLAGHESTSATLTRPARIGGVDLPAGTLAYACSYLTHTRADLWPEPQRFDPGRFTAGRPQPFTSIPFGGGRRRCIGAAFAQMQLQAVLTVAARRVDLRVVDPADEPMRRRGVVIAPGRGARVPLAACLTLGAPSAAARRT